MVVRRGEAPGIVTPANRMLHVIVKWLSRPPTAGGIPFKTRSSID
jgi:hypothetical protein